MWIFKSFLFLALLFVLVYFFVTNANQTVDINLFGRMSLDISIYWIAVASFLLGFAASFFLAVVREIRFRGDIRRLKKADRDKDREIADLRTLPLRDLPESGSGTRSSAEGA